jgi:putative FmdB family regulatory protein
VPIYEFVCEQCDHEFESLQRLSDPLPEQCPSCSGGPVRKNVSAAGFRLKGGGWYETDFKSGGKKNLSGSESKGDGGADSGASSSGDKASGDSPASGAAASGGGADKASGNSGGKKDSGGDSKPKSSPGGASSGGAAKKD